MESNKSGSGVGAKQLEASGGSGGQGNTWASDGPSVVEMACAAAACDEATMRSNLANEGFPADGKCSGGMFMYTATLTRDQLEMAQKETFLDTGFESCEIMSCSAAAAAATGICDGGAIYVSGYSGTTKGVNGMYSFNEEGQKAAYVNGDNGIWYTDGSWKLQTSDAGEEMVQSSQMGKSLKTGDFGQGIMISCDDAYNKLNDERKRVAELTRALKLANDAKLEAENERENCRGEKDRLKGEKEAAESSLDICQQDKTAAEQGKTDAEQATQDCMTGKEGLITPEQCECDGCPDPVVCDKCEECPEPECPEPVVCPDPVVCPEPEDCPACPAPSGDCQQTCVDDLSSPILFDQDYWFCDELTVGDCSNATHGEAVSQACRKLCGSCQDEESEVCDEKYHTKVVIDGVGSIYCDQIYPEECQEFDSVAKTCCKTCKN